MRKAKDVVALSELAEDIEEALVFCHRLGPTVFRPHVIEIGFDGLLKRYGSQRRLEIALNKSSFQLKGFLSGYFQVPGFQAAALVLAVEPEVRAVDFLFA